MSVKCGKSQSDWLRLPKKLEERKYGIIKERRNNTRNTVRGANLILHFSALELDDNFHLVSFRDELLYSIDANLLVLTFRNDVRRGNCFRLSSWDEGAERGDIRLLHSFWRNGGLQKLC